MQKRASNASQGLDLYGAAVCRNASLRLAICCLLTLNAGAALGMNDGPSCSRVQTFLNERAWRDPEAKGADIFIKTSSRRGDYTHRPAYGRTVVMSYELQDKRLYRADDDEDGPSRSSACEISVSYLSGECRGDVSGYFVKIIGTAIRFTPSWSSGSDRWYADSVDKKCDADTKGFTLVPG